MAMNLTTGQKKVLYQAGNFGARKRDTLSKYWRNFDQLERRGFIKRGHGGLYMLTDAALGSKLTFPDLPVFSTVP